MMDLTETAAYSNKAPYDLLQESEGIPIVRGHCVEDLTAIPVAPWKRTGALGSARRADHSAQLRSAKRVRGER